MNFFFYRLAIDRLLVRYNVFIKPFQQTMKIFMQIYSFYIFIMNIFSCIIIIAIKFYTHRVKNATNAFFPANCGHICMEKRFRYFYNIIGPLVRPPQNIRMYMYVRHVYFWRYLVSNEKQRTEKTSHKVKSQPFYQNTLTQTLRNNFIEVDKKCAQMQATFAQNICNSNCGFSDFDMIPHTKRSFSHYFHWCVFLFTKLVCVHALSSISTVCQTVRKRTLENWTHAIVMPKCLSFEWETEKAAYRIYGAPFIAKFRNWIYLDKSCHKYRQRNSVCYSSLIWHFLYMN